MICYVKVCSVVRGIMTFLKVPTSLVITAIQEFYMSSSWYYIKLHETLLDLLRGILEKKSDVKRLLKR
jgi:hypothetical protein